MQNAKKQFNQSVVNGFKKEGMVVIDDILPLPWIDAMRYWALTTDYDPDQIYGGGYRTRDFGENQKKGLRNDYFPIPELRNVVELLSQYEILKDKEFNRGWFFIHHNKCPGVGPHADPAAININIWVTPDWCIEDKEKNGLKVWDQKHPEDWTWDDYNRKSPKIDNFLKETNAKPRKVDYKWNRGILFDSSYFHATDDVHTKPGHHNKRINFTFMFLDKDKNAQDYL
jgi:hypothetical protein